jgi:RNA polymerase sigma-70 factor (ECF subfamily)
MTELDFRQVFNEQKDTVYGFALRMTGSATTAEDLAQDCFLELLRHPNRFDSKRGSLRAYLFGVTRNLTLRRWRTERRLDSLDDDAKSWAPDPAGGGLSMLINAALQSLPALQREAVVLFEYEGFTLEEIARITDVDVGAVKSRLHRARERLRILLQPLRNGTRGD